MNGRMPARNNASDILFPIERPCCAPMPPGKSLSWARCEICRTFLYILLCIFGGARGPVFWAVLRHFHLPIEQLTQPGARGVRSRANCDNRRNRRPLSVRALQDRVIGADFGVRATPLGVRGHQIGVRAKNGDSGESEDAIRAAPGRNSPGQGPVPICPDYGFEVSAEVR